MPTIQGLRKEKDMKKIIALALALVMVFALASVALAAQSTLAVNFKSYVNSKNKYSPSSTGKLEFSATACVYATQDSTTPLTGYAYEQEFKVTALSSGQSSVSFGTDYEWNQADATIRNLSSGQTYTCQFGNTQAQYYIKGSVVVIHG